MSKTSQEKISFNPETVPEHIAIIMDGNGRWAKRRMLPRLMGHRKGVAALRTALEACGDWGVKYLTVYAFSTENWKRPEEEVGGLMRLLEEFLKQEIKKLKSNDIALRVIGDTSRLPENVRTLLEQSIEELSNCKKMTLVLALNYGGRDEITRACKKIATQVSSGNLNEEDINPELIENNLDTAGIPDPELLIRTAGEMRLSNFMLWQLSYAEYYATDLCWPDFGRKELGEAIVAYQKRTRKFGAVIDEK